MATWDLFHLEDESSDFTPFFVKFTKKMEIRGEDRIWELLVLFTRSMNAQNYHVFLEFTDQMEKRGKDGIWELSVLLSLAG